MRGSTGFIILLAILCISSCKEKPIQSFELTISDHSYSLASSVIYRLTNKKLTIIHRGELENEKDSVLYTTLDLPNIELRKLSEIDIKMLDSNYRNECIEDGDIKSVTLKKNGTAKTIHLENYYHSDLSKAIELINKIVPEKYKMNYDKNSLIEEMKNCGIAVSTD